MDLFEYMRENFSEDDSPLAKRMRPTSLDDVVGQEHIIGKDKLLYRAIKADKISSLIFYGPPGTGKTTLAMVIANTTKAEFRQLNATTAGKKDMEKVVEEAKDHGADKGGFLGSKLKDGDRVVMIEDVTTSGKSMEETVPKVREAADVTIVGLMVSLNRMEVGQGGKVSALDEIHEKYGFEGKSIVTMAEVTEYLYNREHDGRVVIDDTIKAAIDEYYKQYGCK